MKRVPLPAEFRLVAAVAIWPPGPRRVDAVRRAAAEPIDWARFQRIVRRHRVAGLAEDGLRRAGIVPPPEAAARLAAEARRLALANVGFAAETARLQRLFDASAIPVAFLKGASLAMLAYGGLAQRHAKDIDFLIPESAIGQASALLDRAGYDRTRPAPHLDAAGMRRYMRHEKDMAWRHRESGREVEMHWRLTEVASVLPELPGVETYREVAVSPGFGVRTFGADDLFAYACVHGAVHGWCRLKWLADIGAWLAGLEPAEIERLYRAAIPRGAGRSVAQALLLCERLFGSDLPAGLAAALRRDPAVRLLERVGLAAMTHGRAEIEIYDLPVAKYLVRLSHLLLVPGWRHPWAQSGVNLSLLASRLWVLCLKAVPG